MHKPSPTYYLHQLGIQSWTRRTRAPLLRCYLPAALRSHAANFVSQLGLYIESLGFKLSLLDDLAKAEADLDCSNWETQLSQAAFKKQIMQAIQQCREAS